MKFRMGSMTVDGANPIGHLLNRQIGNNIYYFRRNLFRERLASARNLYRKNLVAHYGCVNAIEFSSSGDLLVSGELSIYLIQFISFSSAMAITHTCISICAALVQSQNGVTESYINEHDSAARHLLEC